MSLKQGLTYLIEQAKLRGVKTHYDQKIIIIPIYSFINQLISSLKSFLNNHQYECWYAYFLDQHLYDRSLSNMIKSWEKLKNTSLECYLLQNLLIVGNRNKLKLYLKARKLIVQTAPQTHMLDQILLTLQDAIAVIHKLFVNQQIRKALIQGIKNIFMAFKMFEAKIYSSVLIEYLLAVYDSVFKLQNQEATISGQFTTYKSFDKSANSNYVELYSSISNFQSEIHNQNGLYKKNNFSQASRKKYQIIEKKFLPLKQTSQFISNDDSNKFANSINHKSQTEKQKSLFYEFITQNSQKQQQTISEQENEIQMIHNFSKSFDKSSFEEPQRPFQRSSLQRSSIQKPTNDRERNITSNKQSLQRKNTVQSSKFSSKFMKKQVQSEQPVKESDKKFSLVWFSNKFFEQQKDKRQSYLRKSKTKLKKQAQSRQKIISKNTQKYEIQNHLLNKNINISKEQLKQLKVKQQVSKQQYDGDSVKSQQFQKMIEKNQEFKQKMLKKSYPSNGQIFQKQSFQKDNEDWDSSRISQKTSHFGSNNQKNTYKSIERPIFSQNDVTELDIKRMKQRNNKIVNSYSNIYQNRNSYHEQDNLQSNDKQKQNYFCKAQINQKWQQKPQIIHKSIGQSKRSQLYKYSERQPSYQQRQYMERIPTKQIRQKSPLNINKMKSLIGIRDDYRQNAEHQNQQSQFEISQSICKRSKFDSGNQENVKFEKVYSFKT